jgi:hypothetical protein
LRQGRLGRRSRREGQVNGTDRERYWRRAVVHDDDTNLEFNQRTSRVPVRKSHEMALLRNAKSQLSSLFSLPIDRMSSTSHLDPLASDYLELSSKSSIAHTTNLANVSTIISRLELAKSQLAGTALPRQDEGVRDAAPTASDTLLPLSSFVKQANGNAHKEMKEWGNAVTRFSKSVDKVSFRSSL